MSLDDSTRRSAGSDLDDAAWFASESTRPAAPGDAPDAEPPPIWVTRNSDGQILVRGDATIHHATALCEQLRPLSGDIADHASIDLSGITNLDTAGAQVLIAFKRACRSASIHSCPPTVRHFLELTGLTCLLTDEER